MWLPVTHIWITHQTGERQARSSSRNTWPGGPVVPTLLVTVVLLLVIILRRTAMTDSGRPTCQTQPVCEAARQGKHHVTMGSEPVAVRTRRGSCASFTGHLPRQKRGEMAGRQNLNHRVSINNQQLHPHLVGASTSPHTSGFAADTLLFPADPCVSALGNRAVWTAPAPTVLLLSCGCRWDPLRFSH